MYLARAIQIFLALAAIPVAKSAVTAKPHVERSISTSRQFIVYAPSAQSRGAICGLAERTKTAALTLLQQRDEWKTPILVHLAPRAADLPDLPAARLNLSQTGFGLKLQLELIIGSELDASAIERELLSAVLLEFMYRDNADIPAGTVYVRPPAWLIDGVLALTSEESNSPKAAAAAQAAVQNRITPLPDFLHERLEWLEPSSRALYHAYSGALVSMLIDLPNGRARLARLIKSLPASGGNPVAELGASFPEMGGDPAALQQRWTNAIARFATRDRFRVLSCEETERQLASVLTIQIETAKRGADVYALDQYPQFIRLPETREALRRLSQALLALSGRANPLYVPIVVEYEKIIARLAHRKIGKITERLARLRAAREEIGRRMTAIDDYMNWFEATQSSAPSGAFADYMKAAELSAEREPRRHDPISVYVDAMEAQLQPSM